MRWVYILECQEGYYYVGETMRLYKRFWEHFGGCGGLNTSIYPPIDIVALYRVNTIGKFFEYNDNVVNTINEVDSYNKWLLINFNKEDEEYDNLYSENNITECFMINKKETWHKIRGGKYTKFDITYNFPKKEYLKDLPVCYCGLPCDIKKNENGKYLFFRCPKKNMWENFKDFFNIDTEPCKFYMEYLKDKPYRLEINNKFEEDSKIFKELYKKSYWLKNIPENDINNHYECVGGCHSGYNYKRMKYDNTEINLCYKCFKNNNDELTKQFSRRGKCYITNISL